MSYLGVASAVLALAIGFFFFVFYAARYYVFTATVLFLNIVGRKGGNSNGNGNGNGNGGSNGNRNGTNHNGLRGHILGFRRNRNGNEGNGHKNGNGHNNSEFSDDLAVEPLVSIHLPLYNEPNVAERLLTACTSLDYRNYEVIVIDDSTDATTDILRKWAESNQVPMSLTDGGSPAQVQVIQTLLSLRIPVKIVHRTKRSGFKGGALNEALKHMNPKAEYVIIFDADFIPPPDIIRRFLAYFATSPPSTVLNELVKLDREYADGRISLDEYLEDRQALASTLTENRVIIESFQLAKRSLFELDQLFAEGRITEDEYFIRRKGIMRELGKSSWLAAPSENRLTLRQGFTICKLFSADKVDSTDFKQRMRMISTPYEKGTKEKSTTAEIFLKILDLDESLANGRIDLKAYGQRRQDLATQLLVLSENRDKLRTKFDLDQQLAKGTITLEEYLQKQNGKNGNGNNTPKKIVHLISKNGNNGDSVQNGSNGNGHNEKNGYVAVQGYQLHYLNRSENWLTQGIRAEFSGSYMIERSCEEIFGAMKMIAGSVYMIRADTLRKYGWSDSITEDWELTCRLYRDGSRIIYSPEIQAPAECPSTIKRLIRQRQRWAEGHTYNAKRYFWSILRSPHVTMREKLEFVYFAPYYLQSVFFIVGTLLWLASEYLHEYPPFWNQTFGWALLLSNLMALPLMNLSGLMSEGTAKKDLTGIFSAIVLSYILSVFQAYAALKGLFEKKEGTWIRTYKTGVITETIRKFQLGKYWHSLARPRRTSKKTRTSKSKDPTGSKHGSAGPLHSIRPMVILLLLSLSLIAVTGLSFTVKEVQAALPHTPFYFYNDAQQNTGSTSCSSTRWGTLSQTAPSAGSLTLTANNRLWCWASDVSYSVGTSDNGVWTFHFIFTSNNLPGGYTITISVYLGSSRTTRGTQRGTASISTTGLTSPKDVPITVSGITSATRYVQFTFLIPTISGSPTITMTTSSVGSTLIVPESVLMLAGLVPLIPFALKRRHDKRAARLKLPTESALIKDITALPLWRPLLVDHVPRVPSRRSM
jgi:cellulose synthase/poly-beta-1,6-N-acetylglucosamine synthase-like glycosyltransferase